MSAPARVMPTFVVERAGASTTVQDLGRSGFESSGVPRGGAFDPWAARAANRLVGTDDGAALLELTLAGPTLRFHAAAVVALVGGDFELRVDGEPRARHESIALAAGAMLEVGRVGTRTGVRAWLAIGGGLDVPVVLGSRSTELATGFGGHQGRPLRSGDVLSSFPSMEASVVRRFVSPQAEPQNQDVKAGLPFRVLPGPDSSLLGPTGVSALAARVWRVSPRSDRRGVRLEGAPLAGDQSSSRRAAMRSIPMLPGAVELTPAGEPIVLGVDAPVTGGYPWVAQLIEADLGRLAHLAPGAEVRFESVGFEAAERALSERWRALETGIVPR